MTERIAATIVSNNYIAQARVFARSFLRHNPGGKVYVAIVDVPDSAIDYGSEPFETVFACDLGIPSFHHVAFKYSILELNTAVKPAFLKHLRRTTGCSSLCYFDPDILVTADLDELYEKLASHRLVLTPHITRPINDEQTAMPSERDILNAGVFNLGFLGVTFDEDTLRFLDWWDEKVYNECLSRPDLGLFVDQKWMDLAPAFVSNTAVVREAGYNVAYWNLMHHGLRRAGDQWFIGDRKLRFFHFSGYDPDNPQQISKHQNRIQLTERPDLQPLFTLYGRLLEEEGHSSTRKIAYGYSRFDNGATIPLPARQVLQLIDPRGNRWQNPFVTDTPGNFFSWLQTPVLGFSAVEVTRLALALWDQRGDLQAAFPAPTGEHAEAFAEWFSQGPECQTYIDPVFRRPVEESLARGRAKERKPDARQSEQGILAEDGDLERGNPRLPRVAVQIYRQRPDLISRFPDPFGASREKFAFWYVTHGRSEYGLPFSMVLPTAGGLPLGMKARAAAWWCRRLLAGGPDQIPPTNGHSPASPMLSVADERQGILKPETRGVTVVGWAEAPTGVGQACRGSLKALEGTRVPFSVEVLPDGNQFRKAITGVDYDVLLYHVNADMMPTIKTLAPVSRLARFQIGYWFWELSHFPLGFRESFAGLDEVWAPTRFCQQAYSSIAPVPVRLVPPCVLPPGGEPMDRENWGIPKDAFLFLTAFDALSVPERKNPWGAVHAFKKLAETSLPVKVHLLIKVNHASETPDVVDRLRALVQDLPVTLITASYTRAEMDRLLATCDAYVSLHRSEGLGLPFIEAMFCGKPVVGTRYGGCADFLSEETGWPVAYELVTIDKPTGPYPVGAVWADPDIDDAARQMMRVLEFPGQAAERAAAASRVVKNLYSPESAAVRFEREFGRVFRAIQ